MMGMIFSLTEESFSLSLGGAAMKALVASSYLDASLVSFTLLRGKCLRHAQQ